MSCTSLYDSHLVWCAYFRWLITRRARDLVLLAREDIIDLPALAYALWVKDHVVHGSAAAAGVLSPSGRGGGGGVGGGVAASAIRVSMVMEVIEVSKGLHMK